MREGQKSHTLVSLRLVSYVLTNDPKDPKDPKTIGLNHKTLNSSCFHGGLIPLTLNPSGTLKGTPMYGSIYRTLVGLSLRVRRGLNKYERFLPQGSFYPIEASYISLKPPTEEPI